MIEQISEGAEEAILPNSSLPRGKEVDLCMFVDSNNASNMLVRRSRSEFMMYLNIPLNNWYSKKKSTVETSVWCRVCCHERWSGHTAYHLIQVEDDGYPNF